MAFSQCIFSFLLLEYLNNFCMEEQVFIECYTQGGSSVGLEGFTAPGSTAGGRGCPALAEPSVKDAGTPGLGPTGFSRAGFSRWGVGGQRKDGKWVPEGRGEEGREQMNLEGSGASRAFLYAYALIAVAHIIFLLWNAEWYSQPVRPSERIDT